MSNDIDFPPFQVSDNWSIDRMKVVGNDVCQWIKSASYHMEAADILNNIAASVYAKPRSEWMIEDATNEVENGFRAQACGRNACLSYAFAMENYFKAVLIHLTPTFDIASPKGRAAIKTEHHHNLTELIDKISALPCPQIASQIDDADKCLLDVLSKIIMAQGRYPTAFDVAGNVDTHWNPEYQRLATKVENAVMGFIPKPPPEKGILFLGNDLGFAEVMRKMRNINFQIPGQGFGPDFFRA